MQQRRADLDLSHLVCRRRVRLTVCLLVVLAIGAVSALGLARSQKSSRDALKGRFQSRAELAATFVSTYADQLMRHESSVAQSTLSGDVSSFPTAVAAFGFPAAVLLDSVGQVLAITPAKPEVLGKPIASSYPHLSAAVAGTRAVSSVVPSAATGEPVVGFAVPYDTPSGRRVFSGAYAIRTTPLKAYLDAMLSLKGTRVFIVDESGTVVTSSLPSGKVRKLADVDPRLAKAAASRRSGDEGSTFFASSAVQGAPWRVIAEVPSAVLLAPVQDTAAWLAWVVLGLLVLTALVVCVLVVRLLESRARMTEVNERLDKLVHLDALTGVRNRRSTGIEMGTAFAECQRAGQPLAVLMVDVDHFKRINDTFGHLSGDEVLIEVAQRFESALRPGDLLGRWGGEEFLVLMPDSDHTVATAVAQRLCSVIRDQVFALGHGGDEIAVTVSVGVASSLHGVPDVLVATADRALYVAKSAGRDRVHAHAG